METVKQKVSEDRDLGDVFKENENPLAAWMLYQTEETHRAAVSKFIPIPRIKVTDAGVEEYVFLDFDLDMTEFTHVPIKNELLVQNLEDMQDRQRIKGEAIDFEGYNPKKVILEQLRKKPEIDYEKCSALLFKLITQVCVTTMRPLWHQWYAEYYYDVQARNRGNKIYKSRCFSIYCENGSAGRGNRRQNYNLETHNYVERRPFSAYTEKIQSVSLMASKGCV